jgi:hypothetical protein
MWMLWNVRGPEASRCVDHCSKDRSAQRVPEAPAQQATLVTQCRRLAKGIACLVRFPDLAFDRAGTFSPDQRKKDMLAASKPFCFTGAVNSDFVLTVAHLPAARTL